MSPSIAIFRGTSPDRYARGAHDQAVSDADDEARAEGKCPLLHSDERPADRLKRGRVRVGSRQVLSQGHEPQHAEDADENERGLHDPGGDEPEGERFALALVDRVRHDRRADVGDDQQQFQERSHEHRVLRAGTGDEPGVVQHRVVEQIASFRTSTLSTRSRSAS
jgi:hypothetical protein